MPFESNAHPVHGVTRVHAAHTFKLAAQPRRRPLHSRGEMAREQGVDMPICAAVDAILSESLSVSDAVEALLARPQKSEA